MKQRGERMEKTYLDYLTELWNLHAWIQINQMNPNLPSLFVPSGALEANAK